MVRGGTPSAHGRQSIAQLRGTLLFHSACRAPPMCRPVSCAPKCRNLLSCPVLVFDLPLPWHLTLLPGDTMYQWLLHGGQSVQRQADRTRERRNRKQSENRRNGARTTRATTVRLRRHVSHDRLLSVGSAARGRARRMRGPARNNGCRTRPDWWYLAETVHRI